MIYRYPVLGKRQDRTDYLLIHKHTSPCLQSKAGGIFLSPTQKYGYLICTGFLIGIMKIRTVKENTACPLQKQAAENHEMVF